jgi:hypothetical protein
MTLKSLCSALAACLALFLVGWKHEAAPPQRGHRLVLKLKDASGGRAVGGALRLAGAKDANLDKIAAEHGLRFAPLLGMTEAQTRRLEKRAAEKSGRPQAVLATLVAVEAKTEEKALLAPIADRLKAHPAVEFVHLEPLGVPPPGDVSPRTPDYSGQQGYGGPDGIDARGALDSGIDGAGIRISDCEYGWNVEHEDLEDVTIGAESGQTPAPEVIDWGFDEHGTAVAGMLVSPGNGYGVTGLTPRARLFTYSEKTVEGGARRAAAIAAAIADSDPGDVVLLEMQTMDASGRYVPAEYDPAVWTVVKTGTDAGVIVVAAAGNGGQDLDRDDEDLAAYRNRGDSGAIVVGAGTPDGRRERLYFSTYGDRVDVHGWGESVMTLGYGDFAELGRDKNQRYTQFGGTSSASPMVTAAVVLLQHHAVRQLGRRLLPREMREILVSTGRPQGRPGDGRIGPLPDVPAAMAAITGRF